MNSRHQKMMSFVVLCAFLIVGGCKPTPKQDKLEESEVKKEAVVEIVSNGMDIIMVDTLTSGWHTFTYDNRSPDTHLILFDKYPEGKTVKNTIEEVGPPFQNGMDLIMQGKPEEGFAEFAKLPTWFFDVVFVGGVGLISPKHKTEISMKLDPGYYVVECYVKMPNGIFHTSMGMATELIVTEEISPNEPPEADVAITVSGETGIEFPDGLNSGEQVFSVYYKDQKQHEHFLGHDVNLVRIDDNADLSVLEEWMDWSKPQGLVSPAPEGFTFLGGMNDMPAGSTGYFKADLTPGNYVFIAEVPNASQKNMLRSFTISE